MAHFTVITLFVCIFSYGNVEGYRVLGIFTGGSYSHYTLGAVLMNELVSKGHDVTLMHSMKRQPDDKFKSIEIADFMDNTGMNMKEMNLFDISPSPVATMFMLHSMANTFTDAILKHKKIKELLESNEKFDVIIIEQFINDAMKGFCHHFKAPCIVINPVRSVYYSNIPMGNPSNPSYILESFLHHAGPMNFCARLKNTLMSILAQVHYNFFYIPEQNKIMQKYFPNPPAHINDVLYNQSIMFTNSDVTSAQPVPLLPNIIEIGGYHVKPAKKLPDDLQKYLDGCKDGVIYFSMGSGLKSAQIVPERRAAILKALGKLKYNVLWKFEEDLPGKPENVRIDKWFPQQDILAHKNVKLFITHGGLLSTIESIYHGVPVLGLPIFGDQEMNMLQAEYNGVGVKDNFRTLTEESLTANLNEVLNNPKYAANAKKFSKLMHDQPMKPLDKAVFWVDYVVRHKGATHFRSAALDLAWYQYYLLDVIGLILLVIVGSTTALVCLVKRIFRKKKTCPQNTKAKQN